MITQMLHTLVQLSGWRETHKFKKSLHFPLETQAEQLRRILKKHSQLPWSPHFKKSSPADFSNYSITNWSNYQNFFTQDQRLKYKKNLVVRFEPTSGSTFERKWIPYTKEYLKEINRAANVWLSDMYEQYPQIKMGRHYWSLSWLPHDLRAEMSNDDSELFPFWKRWLLSKIFLVPHSISKIKSEEAWRLATQIHLLSQPSPSFVSVWSPTFLIALFELNTDEKSKLEDCLIRRRWVHFESDLKDVQFPKVKFDNFKDNFEEFKKNLKLISCWKSSSSSSFAEILKNHFNSSEFQGKGLWATEGVVTFPYKGNFPLALRSHYYEFRKIKTNELIPLDKLKIGDIVSPIITTSSGLLRYELGDQLLVEKFLSKTPCFEFLGRSGTSDFVGEKLDTSIFFSLKKQLQNEYPQIEYFQFGYLKSPRIGYCVGLPKNELTEKIQLLIADQIEMALQKYHHYRVARQLHQLNPVSIVLIEDRGVNFERTAQVLGQSKPNDLIDFSSYFMT